VFDEALPAIIRDRKQALSRLDEDESGRSLAREMLPSAI
jgi:hypothetical protein